MPKIFAKNLKENNLKEEIIGLGLKTIYDMYASLKFIYDRSRSSEGSRRFSP